MLKKKTYQKKIVVRESGVTLVELPVEIGKELKLKHGDIVCLKTIGNDRILITKKKKE